MRDESPFGLHASTETGLAMEEVLKRRLKTVLEPWRILLRTGKRKVWYVLLEKPRNSVPWGPSWVLKRMPSRVK